MRRRFVGLVIAVLASATWMRAQLVVPNQSEPAVALPRGLPVLPEAEQARMDRDLMEIDIPRLQDLYRAACVYGGAGDAVVPREDCEVQRDLSAMCRRWMLQGRWRRRGGRMLGGGERGRCGACRW